MGSGLGGYLLLPPPVLGRLLPLDVHYGLPPAACINQRMTFTPGQSRVSQMSYLKDIWTHVCPYTTAGTFPRFLQKWSETSLLDF